MLNFNRDIFIDDLTRIGAAAVVGGVLGLERELNGHFAGLRTHMMVAIALAVLAVLRPLERLLGHHTGGNQQPDTPKPDKRSPGSE